MKYDLRLRLVQYASEHGVRPAAQHVGCQVKTVRKWLRRWREDHHSRRSLEDRSRAPHHCPHKTPPRVEALIVRERRKAPCLGARRLKVFCEIPASEGAIGRILRQHGLTRRRKKKYEKKRDLRALKARFRPFEELRVDTKYLTDIPFYVEQLWRNPALPRFQYTLRDVKTGAVFLGFANELSEAHACCFVAAVAGHLQRTGFPLARFATIQSDNGSEFSGAERRVRTDRGFHFVVEHRLQAAHRFIPVGKKNYQAEVESLHERVEAEFFDLETFPSRPDFFAKSTAWQLWWNTTRLNTYKGLRSPDQILLQDRPQRDPRLWFLPALDLDQLLAHRALAAVYNKHPSGGYYLPAFPVSLPPSFHSHRFTPTSALRLSCAPRAR